MTVKLNKKNMKTLETLNTPIQINNQRGLSNPAIPLPLVKIQKNFKECSWA